MIIVNIGLKTPIKAISRYLGCHHCTVLHNSQQADTVRAFMASLYETLAHHDRITYSSSHRPVFSVWCHFCNDLAS